MERQIEEKWVKRWEAEKCFEAMPDYENSAKTFVTMPFPYMNGPMHIGHAFTALRLDVYARYKRMDGYNTLFPFAWHWTGQPIVAAAERLSKGDPAMEREFIEIDGIPRQEITKFFDPEYMARYYSENAKNSLKQLGLSIDWRREFHTTDLEPAFNQFVLWQMNKLRSKGFITLGTHPVVWCPHDQSPTGDHDRLEGEGVTWEEFTVVLFPLVAEVDGPKLAAATLRPETVFAVTNMWINPSAKYVEVLVDDKEKWIVSAQGAAKLSEQLRKIEISREFTGADFVGKRVANPLDRSREILVLPAAFVDPNNATGIVYGVPAHAPFDFIALQDLKQDPDELARYNLAISEVKAIKPIALIEVPSYGEFPAVEIVEKMKIKDQSDPKLSEATKEIYRSEFHKGRLNSNGGRFKSMLVSEVKHEIEKDLENRGLASKIYDLPEKVVCRCLTECIVKILTDQWFLKYSDAGWKRQAHECVDRAAIYPENARQWYHDVIEWLRDWPCARRVGLGTPLPWSKGWIVETLSDSTIYTSFYTILAQIRGNNIDAECLTEALFDYVFLGEGKCSEVAAQSGVPEKLLENMRREFLHWYPVDIRNSAKELIPNHLTFYVFQHCAFFPKNLWPAGIAVNGMMMNEGVKMSKSKGNVITLEHAISNYGSDALRAALINGAEGMDDLDWREKSSRDIQKKAEALASFVSKLHDTAHAVRSGSNNEYSQIDFWLESTIQRRIQSTRSYIDAMKTKSAFQEAFFNFWNDIRHYLDRTEFPNGGLIQYGIDTWIRLLAPFIPFTSEELNRELGGDQIVSVGAFPRVEEKRVHEESELEETLVSDISRDAKKIIKILKARPATLHVYVAPEWAYSLMISAIGARKTGAKMSELLGTFFEDHPGVPKGDVASAAQRVMKSLNDLGEDFLDLFHRNTDRVSEFRAYTEALNYLERDIGVRIFIHKPDSSTYDPKKRAKSAVPFRPALYFE